MRRIISSIILILSVLIAIAQVPNRGGGERPQLNGTLYGRLVESKSGKSVEYASVQLFGTKMDTATKTPVETFVTGMLTKANGQFLLENVPVFGQYKLKVSAIGFKPLEQTVSFGAKPGGDMSAMLGAIDKDLGNLKMEIEETMLENVTVTGSNPGLRLGIDRKVFNVDKNIVSQGGTAVDVMRNVPSVSVDLDGNVTMRNNAPQIFVDGRPTTMTLDQIPADAIESVEIISNPSAKFDASGGTSGILNVVLKKNKKVGYNGSIRTNVDSRARVGLGGDINVRQQKINFFLSGNYNQRKSISTGTTNRTTFDSPNSVLNQNDKSTMIGSFSFGRAGFDWFMDNRNTISVSGRIAKGSFNPSSFSLMETEIFNTPVTSSLAERSSASNRDFQNSGTMVGFKHLFPKAGQELTADVNYNSSRNTNTNLITMDSLDYGTKNVVKSSSQRQDGNGSNDNFVFQTDYVNPFGEKSKLELGARVQISTMVNRNNFFQIDGTGNSIFNPDLSVNYNSEDKIYAAYSSFSNQVKNFGYQLGLRVESSLYEGHLPEKGQDFNIKFPVSLFPSIFLSNKMKDEQELQINYTRRINRPNFFQLYPYTDFSDSLNISRGNPNLKPEFTNSVELSYFKTFKNRDNFLASVYYKNTNDLITRFQVKETNPIDSNDILVNTYINARASYVTGLELISRNKITKWWDLTTNLNLFTSRIDLNDPTQPKQDQFASWFTKINNTFKVAKNFSMQLSGEYQSKSVLPPGGSGGGGGGGGGGRGGGMFGQTSSSQGFVRSNYFLDAGFRFEFLKNNQASVSLNINDILRTRRSNVHSESPFFVQDVFRRRDPQVLRLNFNWRFGKFDANLFKRKNDRQTDATEGMNMGQ